MAEKVGYKISSNMVLRLMDELNLAATVYSHHMSGYHSYDVNIGTVNDNLLRQNFTATKSFSVMHTDVTQVKLTNNTWGYISAIMDEVSREIITIIITDCADRNQLALTIDDFALKMPIGSQPIMHSDHGWQYQHKDYQNAMKELGVTLSMSRKENCHDNAPIESFFNLMKRECPYRITIDNLEDLKQTVAKYVFWYNAKRISMNKKWPDPVEYREQTITQN
ncbi:IS3 family transposase [Lactiplantibacillus plantarum]|uniref:IS3 family transposase n=1 Tax=Lactiplantibacillus plantarum TaxID=1590 RepID=UPI001BAC3E68|nr:IS3 family transposase [Lactiplantibacillus plantarum]MBS0941097.1 IS3 family transposase [Lactiplantibacillus plantarum]